MTLKLIPHAKQQLLQQQGGCSDTCSTTVTGKAPPCIEGTWGYEEFKALFVGDKCDFPPGEWSITLETAWDVPDAIEETVIGAIGEYFTAGAELKSVKAKGKKITITFTSKGSVIAILLLLAAITAFVAITTVTIAKAAGGMGIMLLLIVVALGAGAAYKKKRSKKK